MILSLLKIKDLEIHFFQTMSNVIVFKKFIGTNFDGFDASRQMLVKSESVSEVCMKFQSGSAISMAKLSKALTKYLLVVNDSKIGTKNFTDLYVCVCKADKIGQKDGQSPIHFLCS